VSEEGADGGQHGNDGKEAPAETGDAIFDSLWARVLETWDDDKPHQAFLDYAIRTQRLPDAAGRYRAQKDAAKDDPARAARAQKKLDGIVIAATHMLMAMKTPPGRTQVPPWITLSVFGIVMVLVVWLYSAMHASHGRR
jgi:hypothetical protein